MTGDIPEHLTDAAVHVWRTSPNNQPKLWRDMVAAVLAALRPEDAHLVPAWVEQRVSIGSRLGVAQDERDEARAEAERLRESCRDAGTFAKELHAENERLKAENEPTP